MGTRLVRIVVIVSLLAIIGGMLLWQITSVGKAPTVTTLHMALESGQLAGIRSQLNKSLRTLAPEAAYTMTKQALAQLPQDKQHLAAHLFGEALYRSRGVDGVAVCDDSFGFGCYHGFFGTAIAAEGTDALITFDKACVERFGVMGLGCPHGIGHGLGEYFGPGRLGEQLAVCAKLSWQGTYFGCSGGVFMEYNFPTMVSGNDAITSTRAFRADDPYGPCDRIEERYRSSCYLELSAWYYDALNRDIPAIDGLCGAIADAGHRRDCYRGLGIAIVPHGNYARDDALARCDLVKAARDRRSCYAGISWSFFAHPQYTATAPEICRRLPAADAAVCQQEAQLLTAQ